MVLVMMVLVMMVLVPMSLSSDGLSHDGLIPDVFRYSWSFFFLFFESLHFRLCFFGYPQQQLKTRSGRIVDNVKRFRSFLRDEFNKFQI